MAIVEAGLTQEALAKAVGIGIATLKRYVAGGATPDEQRVMAMAAHLNVTPLHLVGAADDETDRVDVPIYPIEVAAGPGRFLTDDQAIGARPFDRDTLASKLGRDADLAIVRVAGDSMEPDLRDGDSVMIDRNSGRRDGIAVVRVDDTLLIKRIQMEGRTVRLVSSNPAYKDQEIDLSDQRFEFVGRAVWTEKWL